jgi:hypothetical protein
MSTSFAALFIGYTMPDTATAVTTAHSAAQAPLVKPGQTIVRFTKHTLDSTAARLRRGKAHMCWTGVVLSHADVLYACIHLHCFVQAALCCLLCCAGWGKVSPPDRSKQHAVMLRVRPLLQVLAVLEPRALQQLQQQVSRPSTQSVHCAFLAPKKAATPKPPSVIPYW